MLPILKELLDKKSKEDLNANDREKLSMIEAIINNPNWCDAVDLVTALDYMTFLGLPSDKAMVIYNELKNKPGVRDKYIIGNNDVIDRQGNSESGRPVLGNSVAVQNFEFVNTYRNDNLLRENEQIRLQNCFTGEILTFNKSRRIIIGRMPALYASEHECDKLPINSHEVSRNHAVVTKKYDGTFWLKDLNSTNGTYIDDKKIPGMEEIEIQPGTVFKVADVKLKLLSDDENKDDTDKPSEKSSAVLLVSDNNAVLTDFETDTDEKKEAKQRRLTGESISDSVKGNGRLKSIIKKVLAYVSKERNTSAEEMLQESENAGKKEKIDTDSLHKTTKSERPGVQKVESDRSEPNQKLQTISDVTIPDKGHDQCYVPGWMDIIAISVCENYAIGLKKDGTVVTEGIVVWERCNESDWTDITAISAEDDYTVGLKKDGTVVAKGSNYWGQCNVSDWTDIIAISAGYIHTVGLKKDGTVVATGNNDEGQCYVSDWTDIIAISACAHHTVALKKDGTVVATGNNDEGQCYVSDWTDIIAISAGAYHTVGLKKDGTVIARGLETSGRCSVSDLKDITAISAGYYHTVGLKKDGTVVTKGANMYGQCNVSGWTDIIAISAGSFHTFGLKKDGTVVKAGDWGYGQIHLLG